MVGGLNSELPILWRMLTVLSPLSRKIDDLTQVFDRLKIAGTRAAVNTRLALEQNNSGKTNVFSRAFSEDKRGMLLPDNIIGLEAMNFMVAGGVSPHENICRRFAFPLASRLTSCTLTTC